MPADEASSLLAEVIAYPPDEDKHSWPQQGIRRSSPGTASLRRGKAMVAQVPSEIDEWIEQRAASRGKDAEIAYLGTGDIVSRTLGATFCIQRAGDRLITRPVFLTDPGMEDVHHQLPSEAWDFF